MLNKTSPKTRYSATFDLVVISGGIFAICFLSLLHFYLMCYITGVCHFCAHLCLLVLQIDGNNLYLEPYRLNNYCPVLKYLEKRTDF